jgi:hypothetical protein
MDVILRALRRAGRDLFTGRMFALLLVPMGLALLVWGTLAGLFGAAWKDALVEVLAATPLQSLATWAGADWLLAYSAIFFLILLWLPAVYVSALLITSLALMPAIVGFIAGRDYPALERRRGGSVAGSLGNGLYALTLYLVAWLLCLPLWLFGPLGALASLWLNTWLNQRLFLYDALAEHADAAELRALRHEGGWRVYALSGILGLLHLIPVVGLLAPVYMGLAFGHYALDRLDAARSAPR